MNINHISLTNFRLFSRLDIDMPRRILLLVGGNAQGKTSLLESIYYFATYTSFQANQDRQLINFHSLKEALAVGRMVIDFNRGEKSQRIEVRLILDSTKNGQRRMKKEILIDGVKRPVQQALGVFNAVIFLPQMTRIIEDGPDERRRFLNLLISQKQPDYAANLSEYAQVVSQRNALLKQIADRHSDSSQLSFWDDLLTKRGSRLIFHRIQTIHEIEQIAARIHHKLTDGKEVLRILYQPSYDPLPTPKDQYALPMDDPISRLDFDEQKIQQGFAASLLTLQKEEIARGVTTIGPHRDEIRFLANGVDLGIFGSRGQVRTALLSLKLAEARWLYEKTGHWPVLLLDEIMAELDTQRRMDLTNYLVEFDQVLLSTTDQDYFSKDFCADNTIWFVENGLVQRRK